MRGVVMHAPGDVRVEDRPEPTILKPTDAIIRLSAACICGSDLWPYRGADDLSRAHADGARVRRHRRGGRRRRSTTIKPGQFVVGSFFASDNTCEICRAGYQTSCLHREASAHRRRRRPQRMRVPLADGTLVATPEVRRRRPGAGLPGRLRRPRHRLVRRRRRRGRPGQDRRGGR